MFMVMTSIGSLAVPPLTNMYWVLNVLRHWSMAMMETSTTVGLRRGSVIFQKVCQREEPSTMAAS